ncbi:Xaa-Pro aminopeptidase [invertebrate metagenome]|uniref:Xaa-Pro aminopeptidase n=1 Tax=invertebrate metagenome TaxID=1711999 RepID=A0A484H5C8_9ZZZZ
MIMTLDDESLRQNLADNGLALTVAEVRDLLSGVIAAPLPASREPEWLVLVTPEPTPALRGVLLALHDQMKAVGQKDRLGPDLAAAGHLHILRAELTRRHLGGFIIPRADEHQGEHVPRQAERLNWLTGFTGSAGVAIVLQNKAALFVDGRYSLQAHLEVDSNLFDLAVILPAQWLATHAEPGQCIGYDPWLHTPVDVRQMETVTAQNRIRLKPCDTNPIDSIWHNQPHRPLAPVVPHLLCYAGESGEKKRRAVAADLAKIKADATVLAAPDSIAWLLNIRGGDVPYTPLPLAFAILYADARVELFLDKRKLTPSVIPHIGPAVCVLPPESFGAALEALGKRRARVCLDLTSVPTAVADRLRTTGAYIAPEPNLCALHQACKNEVELDGLRAAHCRDGIALVQFLCWLNMALANGYPVTERTAADQLQVLRRQGMYFRGLSFATISATGPHSAIVHYGVTQTTDLHLQPGHLYLVDSGAQYLDGTTDVTRTIAIGSVGVEPRRRFTQVLKGHIALATAVFPVGTTGGQLDILARRALWAEGIDYDHGTGHGVGSYLNVHEGPHRISAGNTVPLVPGMIVSDEPGYYKAGAYGIRIESLLAVCPVVPPPAGAERSLLAFEVLTLVPIDRTLIDSALLSPYEQTWIDTYHARVRDTLTPFLDKQSAAWLARETEPLN